AEARDRHAARRQQADRGPHHLRAGRRRRVAGAGPDPQLPPGDRAAHRRIHPQRPPGRAGSGRRRVGVAGTDRQAGLKGNRKAPSREIGMPKTSSNDRLQTGLNGFETMQNHATEMMPKEMASAVNLFVHPAAGMAAASALGFGLASQAFGMWLGALSGMGEA